MLRVVTVLHTFPREAPFVTPFPGLLQYTSKPKKTKYKQADIRYTKKNARRVSHVLYVPYESALHERYDMLCQPCIRVMSVTLSL